MTDSEHKRVPERLLENGHVAVKRCKHGPMAFNVNDTFVGRSLDLYGEWGESELALLGHLIRPGSVVLDIGANIGTHTVYFAQKAEREGLVIAFEPQRLAHQLLCANVALNALTNVRCMLCAVGDAPGRVSVPEIRPDRPCNMGGLSVGQEQGGETVEALVVDTLDLPGCHVVKIDVEGMEVKVLAGAERTIRRHRPVLFVENNTVEGSADVIRAVTGLDYAAWWHICDYYNPDNFFGNAENVFARFQPEANLLCFPTAADVRLPGAEPVTGPGDDWRQAVERLMRRRRASGPG